MMMMMSNESIERHLAGLGNMLANKTGNAFFLKIST
jgi:hypothetical protein